MRSKMTIAGRLAGAALAFVLGLGLPAPAAQAQSFSWAKPTTFTGQKSAVVADKLNNSYVLSTFSGSVTVGGNTYTSAGGTDLLLIKYLADGTVQWARRIGGPGNEQVGDIILTVNDWFLYLAGSFQGVTAFEDNNGAAAFPLTSAGQSDAFVAKYSTQFGFALGAWRAGGTGDDYGFGLDADKSDNIYLTGSFTGQAVFPGPVQAVTLSSQGNSDIFLAKYDSKGAFKMARQLGGGGADRGSAVGVDQANGDMYLTGGLSPAGNPLTHNVFVAKFNALGILQWNKQMGSGPTSDRGNDLVVTPNGAYVTGYFGGSITFGAITLTSSGSTDAFVAYYPTAGGGVASWAIRMGGTGWDEGTGVAYRPWDNGQAGSDLLLAGHFTGTATLGPITLHALGGSTDRDLFVARLLPNGSPNWACRIGSTSSDNSHGLDMGTSNTFFCAGRHGAPFVFGPSALGGSGNLLMRLDLPTVNDFQLINAASDAEVKLLNLIADHEFNYMTLGTNQINLRANVTPGTTGSVRFVLDGVTVKTDNQAPFTWAGDQPKPGGTDYLAFTPALGAHTLVATAYSGFNGTGVKGLSRTLTFTVTDKPVVNGVTFINAATDQDLPLVYDEWKDGGTPQISYAELGTNQINFRANVNSGKIGSVKFSLNGKVLIDNQAPFTWGGDQPKPGGGTDYLPVTLPGGYYTMDVWAYTGAKATGTVSQMQTVKFQVNPSGYRIAAAGAEPESLANAFRAAPNPFARRTALTFAATADGPAVVEVYNAQGVPVARLFEGALKKGKAYQWEFDGTHQPNGLYIARLKAGNRVLHQRLVLSK